MFLGLGLSLTQPQAAASAPTFNPATLPFSLWCPGSFTASPWAGAASAGTSGTHNLTEGTNPPAAGTAVNGSTPARFDGVNDRLIYTPTADLVTTTAFTIGCLAKATAPPADPGSGNRSSVPLIYATYFGMGITTTGVCAFGFDSTYRDVHVAATTTGFVFAQAKLQSGNVYVRANNGAWSSPAACGTLAGLGTFQLGVGNLSSFAGDVFQPFAVAGVLSDAELNNFYSYLKATYPAAGLP